MLSVRAMRLQNLGEIAKNYQVGDGDALVSKDD